MASLVSKTNDFTWPNGMDLEEELLKDKLLKTVWSEKYLAGTEVSLMRPKLIENFDNSDRISYDHRQRCYDLSMGSAQRSKRPDFIFKTGSNEVTLIEVKVCWLDFLDEYPGWYTYNIDKDSPIEDDEEIHSDARDEYDFVRCDTIDPLENRAKKQAFENASLLEEILPSNIVVKYRSFVSIQDRNNMSDVKFFWR